MLCLSGFELHSRWVPLISIIDTGTDYTGMLLLRGVQFAIQIIFNLRYCG